MKPRYILRCFSRVDDGQIVSHGGFPLYFATRRQAERRLEELIRDGGSRSIYRYEIERSSRRRLTGIS